MALKLLILQNSEVEGPGYLLRWAMAAGFSSTVCKPFTGEALPAASSYSHVMLLGSPHSVHEMDSVPWLKAEAEWARSLLTGTQRVLGICLGAQLLAQLLGGQVIAGSHAEIGWHSLEWLPGAKAHALTGAFPLFQWHQEIFTLPPGAQPLARSPATPLQGFAWQNRVWALGGHPEMDAQLVEGFVQAFWRNKSGPFVQKPEQMLGECASQLAEGKPFVDAFLHAWAAL